MKYYLLDLRQIVGTCALLWGKESRGYTTQLEEAGLYDEAEARDIERNGTARAIPEEIAKAASVTHVRVDRLRDEFEKLGKPPIEYNRGARR